MSYLIVDNGIITNVIEATDSAAELLDAKPGYAGAGIGDKYSPPPEPMTTEEAELDLLTDINYRLSLVELGLTTEGDKV